MSEPFLQLVDNAYGKSAIRLVVVRRTSDRHELADIEVAVRFTGNYTSAYRDGDNSDVYPTDSMKNSVYALARDHGSAEGWGDLEGFAARLARHFLERPTPPREVEVTLRARPWSRVDIESHPHPHSFVASGGDERRLARAHATAGGIITFEAGIENLLVLKTTGSAFAGFPRDAFTTLAETEDRILATSVEATWRYGEPPDGFHLAFVAARRRLLTAFAEHHSLSVQHTLQAMAQAVLETLPNVHEIRLRLPNRHHWLANLEPFGLDNPGMVFVATEQPFGLIEGTFRRS